MTAEVAVVNKSAVALAADSAVTIGSGGKVYNSANKLFALTKFHPVGVMIYGNAEFMGIPWETIIKEYRMLLEKKSFPALKEYADDFFKFVSSTQIFSTTYETAFVTRRIREYFSEIKDEASNNALEQLKSQGEVSTTETNSFFRNAIARHLETWTSFSVVDAFAENGIEELKTNHSTLITKLIDEVFEKISLRKSDKAALSEIAALLFSASRFPSSSSGIVIAGFGTKEVFPSVLSYECDCKVGGRMKCAPQPSKSISIQENNDAAVIPFAQSEMVATFMEGIDPTLNSQSDKYLSTLFQDYPEAIVSTLGLDQNQTQGLTTKLREQSQKLYGGYKDFMKKYQARAHVVPVINMVGVLPKDELATMAEALVNLTSFKRKVTADTETVGGPIDVAIISKGDGFVWIKRKHYFDPKLNHHFFANYYRETST